MADSQYPYPPDRFDDEADAVTFHGAHRAELPFWRENLLYIIIIGAAVVMLVVLLVVLQRQRAVAQLAYLTHHGAPCALQFVARQAARVQVLHLPHDFA